jgi:hypothetical protein
MLLTGFLLVVAGGLATSLAEYFAKYNLVDKTLDLFRSAEVKAENAVHAVEAAEAKARARAMAVRKAL